VQDRVLRPGGLRPPDRDAVRPAGGGGV